MSQDPQSGLGLRDDTPFFQQITNCCKGCFRDIKEDPVRYRKLLIFYFGAYSLMTAFMCGNVGGYVQSLPARTMWKNGNVWMGRPSHGNQIGMGEDSTVQNTLVMNRLSYGLSTKASPYTSENGYHDMVENDGAEGILKNDFSLSCTVGTGSNPCSNAGTETGRMMIAGHLNRLWTNHELYSNFRITCTNKVVSDTNNVKKFTVESVNGGLLCEHGDNNERDINTDCTGLSDCTSGTRHNVVGKVKCAASVDGETVVTFDYTGATATTAGAFAPHQWAYKMYPSGTTITTTGAKTLEVRTECVASGNGKSGKDEELIAYSPVFGDKKRILKYDMEDNLKNQEDDKGLEDPTKLVYYTTFRIGA